MGRLKKEEYRDIMNHIEDGYFEIDLAGTFTYANAAACVIYGRSAKEIIGLNYLDYTDGVNAKKAFAAFNRIYKSGASGKLINFEVIRKDGIRRQLEISASLIVDQSGKSVGFRGITRDVTARKQIEEELRQSEERYRTIIEDIEDAYFEVDLRGRFIFVNDALCESLGYSRDELIGMDQRQYGGETTIRELRTLFNRVYRKGAPVKAYAFELYRKDGSKGHCEISVSLIKNREGESIGFRGIARDVTERKKNEEQIRHLATHDILTGLPNRVLFDEVLEQSIKDSRRYGRQFALLFMDLDGFKAINDTFGHETGDRVLIICARRLKRALRASDFIARLGGDEFVILAQGITDKTGVTTLVNTVFSIVNKPILIRGSRHHLTASIGISIYPQDGGDKQSLMKTADMAMYSAKEKGSNNYRFFSSEIRPLYKERNIIERHLPLALARNEFFLRYQPKFDLNTGVISGVEALLRWRNPDLGLVAPMRFIPVAESSGQIIPLGRWVLKRACLQNMAWQHQGLPPIRMAVNLSYKQLLDDRLIADVEAALLESGMGPGLLELEITENLLLTHFPHIISVMNRLKGMGVRVALDDFGSGSSTLAQLRQLPVDTLKIDRSIVGAIPENDTDAALIKAIADFGRALSLAVVAEGVETAEQQAFLRNTSCTLVQGFYFSRPLSPAGITELMSRTAHRSPD